MRLKGADGVVRVRLGGVPHVRDGQDQEGQGTMQNNLVPPQTKQSHQMKSNEALTSWTTSYIVYFQQSQ